MTKQKAAAPGWTPGTASKAQAKSTKACEYIVHNYARKRNPLKALLVALGAAGWGLACGAALPPLLGLCPWRPGPVALGLALLTLGAWAEVSE